MPFTLSHAAAALPVARRPLVPSALVAGTLAPDLTLFSSLGPSYTVTHSMAGVLGWDVLLAIAMLTVWYGILRDPLLALVPAWVSGRVPPRRRWTWPDLFWVPVSACLGAGSHVLWDSFTHDRSIAIWGWEWLGARPIAGLAVFDVLQYLSSIAGLAVIVWWAARRPMLPTPSVQPHESPPRNVVLVAVVLVGCSCSIAYGLPVTALGLRAMVYEAVVGAVTGTMFLLGGYAAVWRVRMAIRD